MDYSSFINEAQNKFGKDFEIINVSDPRYMESKQISNSYYDLFPFLIAFCTNAEQIAFCIDYSTKRLDIGFRIRSGGHQHEGMCSGNQVMIIDVSRLTSTKQKLTTDTKEYWVWSGEKLRGVYDKLEAVNKVIPAGGCGNVSPGGLVQGGGWGPHSRRYGLTCDAIKEVEIVLADGSVIIANNHNEYKDLFWAIRGGGGGNFGVITRYLFKLENLGPEYQTVQVTWPNKHTLDIAKAWANELPMFPKEFTTACRLTVVEAKGEVKGEVKGEARILITGLFCGTKKDLLAILAPIFAVHRPKKEDLTITRWYPKTDKSGSLTDAIFEVGAALQPLTIQQDDKAPTTTCEKPHPHKVSSAYPKEKNHDKLLEYLVGYINKSSFNEKVSKYVTLHGLGGAIVENEDTSFAYRDKAFILQFQAWWRDTNDIEQDSYLEWIRDIRPALGNEVEGAFINFPDKNINRPYVDNYYHKIDLLSHYYGKNLIQLMAIKSKYDPLNIFNFEMSIPLPAQSY